MYLVVSKFLLRFSIAVIATFMNYVSERVVVMTKIVVKHIVADKSSVREDRTGYASGNSGPTSSFRSSSRSTASTGDACSSDYEYEFEEEDEEYDHGSQPSITESPKFEGLDLILEFRNLTYVVQHSDAQCRTCHDLKVRGGRVRSHESDSDYDQQRASVDQKEVRILHNISGLVKGGEILAVIGPSGSGKSTLIDALAQRIARDSLHGSITLNGEEVKNNSIIRTISAYVMQDDLLFPMLTVKETLRFAAELRLPHSSAEKHARVDEVLTQLNLTKVANSIIGDEGHRGISGGEKKRVSIGKEIIHDPLLLFLDEPTSGLDSTNALLVVSTLQRIARTGSIILLSVHQPSERILKLITTILFIAEGQVIYRGTLTSLRDYFETYLGYSVPEGTSTTEYALDLVQDFNMTNRTGITPLVQSFTKYAEQNDYQTTATPEEQTSAATGFTTDDPESFLPTGVRGALAASVARGKLVGATAYLKRYNGSGTFMQKFANSWLYEVYVLARRGILNTRRTPELFLMRFLTVMMSGVLLATIFWQLDDSPQGLKERLGFYAFATSTTYYICVDTLPIFLQERHIFMRETAHDSYRISSYVLAIALINIPFLFLLALAFSVTTFWTVGLSGGAAGYFFFLMVVWASFWAGNSFATLLSALISNVIAGYTVVVAALAYFLLLSGFFITRNRIPQYWLWLHYISMIKYPYEAVLLNEFGRTSSACYETGDQILSGTPFQGSDIVADFVLDSLRPLLQSTKYRDLNGSTCIMNGAAVLRNQNVGELSKWGCLVVTVSFGLFYRLCFYAVLRYTGKMNRR